MIINKLKNKKAFTMIELLVAAAIFSGFMLGVFSLYSVGSKMFASGSWKYNKQKEAERFLLLLKERIEQCSVPSKIVRNGSDYKIEKLENIGFFINSSNGKVKLTGRTYLAEFIISKPDTHLASGTNGLILYNTLFCESQGKDNLFKLTLYTNRKTLGDGNFFATRLGAFSFPPADIDNFITTNGANFNENPNRHGFSRVPQSYSLTDIKSVELKYGITATGTIRIDDMSTQVKKNPVINLKLVMQNPKHKETTVEEKLVTKLDWSVNLCPVVEF